MQESPAAGARRPQWVGRRIRRLEDPRYLTGHGRFVPDMLPNGTLHVAFVRCPHAHARIVGIDTRGLRGRAGVLAAVTAADMGRQLAVRTAFGPQMEPAMPALAWGRAHFAGQAVAAVVAADRYAAEDAAELVRVEYQPLPAVVTPLEALEGALRAHDDRIDNRVLHDERWPAELDEVFRTSPVVVRAELYAARQTHMPIETRGLLADYDPGCGVLTVHASTQMPHTLRDAFATMLGLPQSRVRVVTPDVGGGFGLKASVYPEDLVVAWLAVRLGRPVRWIGDRREAFLADAHARDTLHRAEAAFDRDGNWLALRDHMVSTVGAYPFPRNPGGVLETVLAAQVLAGPYKVRQFGYRIDVVLTNTAPTGPYRGVHGPGATWVHEALIERAARALGVDRVELRRRNMVRKDEFPYRSVTGSVYDPGSYVESLDAAMDAVGYATFEAERRAARARGRILGLGVASFLELSAPGIFRDHLRQHHIPFDSATVRVEPDGAVTVLVGISAHGQGHETTVAQIVADELGLDVARVRVLHGDTTSAPYGQGTAASRSITLGGGAAKLAAAAVREQVVRIAAHAMEVAPDDVELHDGTARVRGAPGRSLPLSEVGRLAYRFPQLLPTGAQPRIEATRSYSPELPVTFSNGCHAAVVELDPETGAWRPVRYVVAEDCGVMINPSIVEGQVCGGVAQGVGSTFLERVVYGEGGQPLTTTWMDYLLPGAGDVPDRIAFRHLETPSSHPGGVKGAGEGGMVAAPAALASAVEDAVSGAARAGGDAAGTAGAAGGACGAARAGGDAAGGDAGDAAGTAGGACGAAWAGADALAGTGGDPAASAGGAGGDPVAAAGGDPAAGTGGDPAAGTGRDPAAAAGGDPAAGAAGTGGDPAASVVGARDPFGSAWSTQPPPAATVIRRLPLTPEDIYDLFEGMGREQG